MFQICEETVQLQVSFLDQTKKVFLQNKSESMVFDLQFFFSQLGNSHSLTDLSN